MKPQLNTIWLIVFLMLKRFGHFFSSLSEKTLPDIRSGNENIFRRSEAIFIGHVRRTDGVWVSLLLVLDLVHSHLISIA